MRVNIVHYPRFQNSNDVYLLYRNFIYSALLLSYTSTFGKYGFVV